eukprot:CAMPEP_0196719568 /NCGR_PEP_ID=MMETSP1091-20130531/2517_1 /TAXON_ID=302021 /ORGANISM="Rhodomonas sp., Strain CCMP768" /LENGTH=203 /DNA_ID=CAMNT_0042060547 /DNA_START=25 /DNA_END=636 /DNA_ORIENTATION=+
MTSCNPASSDCLSRFHSIDGCLNPKVTAPEQPLTVRGGPSLIELKEVMKLHNAPHHIVVKACAQMLEEAVKISDGRDKACKLQAFVGKSSRVPPAQFVEQIAKHSQCSTRCLVVAFVYLRRLKDKNPKAYLTRETFRRMYGVAAMLAAKSLDDIVRSKQLWAAIVGVSEKELKALSAVFLERVGFNLDFSFEQYMDAICSHLQ